MKSIALIHTVKSVANTFEDKIREYIDEEIKVHNLLDDFLANNPNEIGEFSIINYNRLLNDVKNAELTGADIIVTTCSTLTPIIEMIRPFISVPIIAIDDAMTKKAITYGEKLMVLATANSTIEPTKNKLFMEANKASVSISVDTKVCSAAFKAMKALDMKTHDNLLKEAALDIKGYDCIILAQASMAHLENDISKICNCPVLSSPRLCLEQIKQTLKNLNK
ncbi:aspartate/glutamate racemase family protein [Defluviitalea phaphyphila]|uniref:aspartate/glutamate racemase family protein n=1 Tax=Defluviitalea phaphyphila TaxID=1473580 RepID=UPI00072FA9FA|nr:aspartate/glutamate racemase family protein [Defluviitalea phaphyphila]